MEIKDDVRAKVSSSESVISRIYGIKWF